MMHHLSELNLLQSFYTPKFRAGRTLTAKSSTTVQPLKISSTSQFDHNPFQLKRKAFSKQIPKCEPSYLEVKRILDDSVVDSEIVQNDEANIETEKLKTQFFDCKQGSFDDLDSELNFEMKVSSFLTDEMEKELKLLHTIKPIDLKEIATKKINLAHPKHKHTVLLDVDETLIHTLRGMHFSKKYNNMDIINLNYYSNIHKKTIFFQIVKRPYMDLFLKMLSEKFEVVAFTASDKAYADAILDYIDPLRLITHRIYRDSCITRGDHKIKDLRILNRSLQHVIIIDNSITSFLSQLDNGIPVKSFYGECNDVCLVEISNLFNVLYSSEDVTIVLKKMFCLSKLQQSYTVDRKYK